MPFHWFYIVGILLIVLIIFGPGRLPEIGGAIGKAMREFRSASNELTNQVNTAVQAKAEPPAAASPTTESAAKGPTSEANPPKS